MVDAFLAITLTPVLISFFLKGKLKPERANPITKTLDRIYTVLGDNYLTTSIRLYNTTESYYEVKKLEAINHQIMDVYPAAKIYGIEIRFFQPGNYSYEVSED